MLGAAAVGAGDGRCCYWYRSASSLVVTSAPGQSVSYSFAQSSTDWFCSLSCPPVASLIFFGCLWGGIASPNMHLVLLLYLIFRLLPVFLELCSLLLLLRVVFAVSSVLFPNFCTCSLLAVAVVVWEDDRLLCWPVYCCC